MWIRWTTHPTDPASLTLSIYEGGDWRDWRSRCMIRATGNPHLWLVSSLVTKTGYGDLGYGRALIEEIRRWAAERGHTVCTSQAAGDGPGFFTHLGCPATSDGEYVLSGNVRGDPVGGYGPAAQWAESAAGDPGHPTTQTGPPAAAAGRALLLPARTDPSTDLTGPDRT